MWAVGSWKSELGYVGDSRSPPGDLVGGSEVPFHWQLLYAS